MHAKNEDQKPYEAQRMTTPADDIIIAQAQAILTRRLHADAADLSSPKLVRDYLQMHMAELEHEMFGVLWMNACNRFIADDRMFRGTINQTSVYPRELVKAGLEHNAAACILYHNHPSGSVDPSAADEHLTRVLKEALALVDIKVMDHFIVGKMSTPLSFAERGLI